MDWPRLMAMGLGALRLSPDAFWSMTPREFKAALRGAFGESPAPMTRAALGALSARFPDEAKTKPDDAKAKDERR